MRVFTLKKTLFLNAVIIVLQILFLPNTYAKGFTSISDQEWDKNAVRRVLHTFAYGGHMSEAQIQEQANLPAHIAIRNLLNFSFHNPILSPTEKIFSYPYNQDNLNSLGQFLSSSHPQNPIPATYRNIFINKQTGATNLFRTWLYTVVARGYNPFRQKIGLWETNYHLAVNLKSGVSQRQMTSYYDEIMASLADQQQPYQQTLAIAALSSAIAVQYGHRKSKFKNGKCVCNDDFAREYYQLFFGILGKNDAEYHEQVTIKNTANALTGIAVPGRNANVNYTIRNHYPGDLEMLHNIISGKNSFHRLMQLSDIAIQHPESLNNLPVIIIQQLADDNMTQQKSSEIQEAWKSMETKNLLTFLQQYAISKQFHSKSRYKYLTSLDRHLIILNNLIHNEQDIFSLLKPALIFEENVKPFQPIHNNFGAQTGEEAANDKIVFLRQYNLSTNPFRLFRPNGKLKKTKQIDWSKAISRHETNDYEANKIGELLWNRLIGDGLKNYGVTERAYVKKLLVKGNTNLFSPKPEKEYKKVHLELDNSNPKIKKLAHQRIEMAISFIIATPYMFARQGAL